MDREEINQGRQYCNFSKTTKRDDKQVQICIGHLVDENFNSNFKSKLLFFSVIS